MFELHASCRCRRRVRKERPLVPWTRKCATGFNSQPQSTLAAGKVCAAPFCVHCCRRYQASDVARTIPDAALLRKRVTSAISLSDKGITTQKRSLHWRKDQNKTQSLDQNQGLTEMFDFVPTNTEHRLYVSQRRDFGCWE